MRKSKKFEKHLSLPKTISLGYQDITIYQIPSIDNTLGSYNNEVHQIKINIDSNNREKLNTLLHELIHACVYVYGVKREFKDDDQEEKVVNALSNGLTEAFVRNKELVEFVRQSV